MNRGFADIVFTDSVREAQRAEGTRDDYAALDDPATASIETLIPPVAEWLARADSFFISTVGANGWPYVQHRGGKPGMIRLIDQRHFEFDDVAGNGQMITVGNLRDNDRVMLFLIDYTEARRLKLWGRATVRDATPDVHDYRARMRTIRIRLAAWNFNCSSFIPQMVRFD